MTHAQLESRDDEQFLYSCVSFILNGVKPELVKLKDDTLLLQTYVPCSLELHRR
jgi:hypothetical protein